MHSSRHFCIALVIAATAMLLGGCPVDNGDNTDTTNPFDNATNVSLSQAGTAKITGSIARIGGFDVYMIPDLDPGDRVVMNIAATSGNLDAVAAFFDDLRNMVAFNDDREPDASNLNPLLNVIVPEKSGNYYLTIAPFASGLTSGDYSVDIAVTRAAGTLRPRGQIIYLDFAGGDDITVKNVIDGTIDLDPFSATDVGMTDAQTSELKARVIEIVESRYDGYNVEFLSSDDFPEPTSSHSTVFFGGFNQTAFAISQQIDSFNEDPNDDAIIFTESFARAFSKTPTLDEMATAIGNTVAHEVGHLLGLVHTQSCDDLMDTTCGNDSILVDQAFTRAPVDDSVFPFGFQDSAEILGWVLGLAGM